MADGIARDVKYLWHAPFVAALRDHCPILFQITKYWIPAPMNSHAVGCNLQQRSMGRDAFLEDSDLWQRFVQTSHVHLSQTVPTLDPYAEDTFPILNQTLLVDFHYTFPKPHASHTAAWQHSSTWIKNKWTHRSSQHVLVETMQAGNLQAKNIFLFWFHTARFRAMARSHRRHAQLVRKHHFHDIIHHAQKAADRHNSFQLFHLINSFAPKSPKRRMQLRTVHGKLATAVEEHAILCKFVQDVWHGEPLRDAHPDIIPGTPFTESDVQKALESIPLTKAVAPGFAPGVLWRSHAQYLAPWLYGLLKSWWLSDKPFVPSTWRHAWLCWLPKPGKPPTDPAALRPIALQDPVGKAMIGMISQLGQSDSLESMICWPLWAYLPHRSTQDSLLRVIQHCRTARLMVQNQRSTPHKRARQMPRTRLCGAVQLLIDMRRAFDSVDRNCLFERLHTLGVRPEIVKILSCWHQETCYIVQTSSQTTAVPVSRGVRQGCRAAPWLWNSVMTLMLRDLSAQIDPAWLRRCTNLYADDLQTGDLFTSEQELHTILQHFASILAMLSSYGFQINEAKSQILITMTGASGQRVKSQLLVRRNGLDLMRLENDHHSFLIPITTSAKYLGVVISYNTPEDSTVRYRVRLAEVAFHRLRRWLTGRHGLHMKDKLHLWDTCVKPIAFYGVFCTGLTVKGIELLTTMINRMFRRIAQDHAFYTRHTNQQVFQQHGLDSPLQMLWTGADCLHRSVTQRCLALRAHDLVQTLDWSHLTDLKTLLMEQHMAGSPHCQQLLLVERPELRCPICDFSTEQVTTWRKHIAVHHGIHHFRTRLVNPVDHMLHGLPQCKHCQQIFTTWRSHAIHVERGCQVLLHRALTTDLSGQTLPDTMPLLPTSLTNARADAAMRGQTQLGPGDLRNIISHEWGHRLLTLVGTRQFQQLIHEDAINEYLSQRCCLCAQWVGRAQEMHRHLRLFHAPFWPLVMAKSSQLSSLYAVDSPCRFCRSVFKTGHSCNTWTQISLLLIYGAGNLTDFPTSRTMALQCELCDQHLETAEQLHLHLINDHNLASARWNPGRDSIDGGSGCAHCGTIFSNVESLRSHIAQGRCKCFDPSLSCEPKAVTEQVRKALCHGGLTEALQDAHWRLQMTLHCQNCSHTSLRAGDLMLHLRSCHPQLWQDSNHLTALLIGMYYQSWGCICNPTTATKRLNHVCVPLKQLAMQFYRLAPTEVFCPLLVTEQMLAQVYHPCIPRELKFAIDRMLITRDFSAMLQQSDMMYHLTHTCILCANKFCPTDLGLHLREMHECSTMLVSFFTQQLLPVMLGHNPLGHACEHCGMIYDIPLQFQIGDGNDQTALADRALLAQNHYQAHCPGTLQLAIILCRAYNDGRLHHERQPGCLPTGSGGLSTAGTSTGGGDRSRPHPVPESRATETGQKRRRTGTTDSQAGGGDDRSARGSAAHGQASGEARSGPAGGPERNGLPFLFQQQSANRVTEMPGGSSGNLASDGDATTTPNTVATSSTTSVSGPDGRLAHEIDTAGRLGSKVTTGEGGPDEQCSPARPDMPVFGMGPCSEEAQGGIQATHLSAQDGGEREGAHRDEHGGQPGAILPRPADDGGHHTMEADSQHEGRSGILASQISVRVEHMDAHGHQPESPFPEPKQSCAAADEDAEPPTTEGKGQGTEEGMTSMATWPSDPRLRERLLDLIAHASLANPSNWCFVNSTMMAFLWSTLSLRDFESAFWGKHCNMIHDFILSLETSQGNLSCEAWFNDVLQCWGRPERISNHGSISQHDAAEFIGSWLHQLGQQPLDMRWERRMEENAITHKVDESTATLPLFLQFSSLLTQLHRCTLTDLFKCWHQADGMIAALLQPSQALCVHIDRCTQVHQTLTKCVTIVDPDADCVIPMFSDSTLQCEELEYYCVAIQSHLGTDQAGHYRTAVRIRPTVTRGTLPCAWLLCDDWTSPMPVWDLPKWFLQNATIMWLVRGDCQITPEYADSATASARPNAVEAMLALLPMPSDT